jgi:hypothetical protein
MEERKMKIGSIVVRCYEFDKMLAFWREALHYAPREPAEDGWVVLRDPEGRGPNVSLERRYPQEYRPDDDFIVLEDPDGNRFCVVQVPHGS